MKLYKFYWDCGRQGEVEGLFFEDEEKIQSAIGKEIYFGEILGKHSDVYGTLEEQDLKAIDLPEESINMLVSHIGTHLSGYNPLDYIMCSECRCLSEDCECDD